MSVSELPVMNSEGTTKYNCWEFMKCGREPGGSLEKEFGPCPAATEVLFNGLYGGRNAGRCCWLVSRTIRNGIIQRNIGKKKEECRKCDFFLHVLETEYSNMELASILRE